MIVTNSHNPFLRDRKPKHSLSLSSFSEKNDESEQLQQQQKAALYFSAARTPSRNLDERILLQRPLTGLQFLLTVVDVGIFRTMPSSHTPAPAPAAAYFTACVEGLRREDNDHNDDAASANYEQRFSFKGIAIVGIFR